MSRRYISLAVVALSFILRPLPLMAEQGPGSITEVGPEISYIRYKEPGLMEEKGLMNGLAASHASYDEAGLMLKIDGRIASGEVDYSSPYSGRIDGIEDFIFEIRGVMGYNIMASSRESVTPYIGIAYRYLNDDSSGKISTTGAVGYERESNYIYSPIGVTYNYDMSDKWSIGFTAEYDIFWWGRQVSHLSDADPGYDDVDNRQDRGYGYRVSAELRKKPANGEIGLSFEPFFRYWDIDKSDTDTFACGGSTCIGWEPKNSSEEIGLTISILF